MGFDLLSRYGKLFPLRRNDFGLPDFVFDSVRKTFPRALKAIQHRRVHLSLPTKARARKICSCHEGEKDRIVKKSPKISAKKFSFISRLRSQSRSKRKN